MNEVLFIRCTSSKFAELSKSDMTFYFLTDTNKLYLGNNLLTNSGEVAEIIERLNTLESYDVEGSIEEALANLHASDIPITYNEEGYILAQNVDDAIIELTSLIELTNYDKQVIIEHEDNSLVYTIYQGEGNKIGEINIPADMVATSGELYTATSTDTNLVNGNMYIKMTIANGDPFYIPVQNLIDVYTGSNATTGVKINVNDGVITAEVKTLDGSLLDAQSVSKTSLSEGVQSSLDKAESAVQSVLEGVNNGEISVDGTGVKVHGLGTASFENSTAFDVSGAAQTVKEELLGKSTDAVTAKTIEGLSNKIGDFDTNTYSNLVDYIDNLTDINSSADIASKNENVITLKAGIIQTNSAISNNESADIVLASVASTGKASDVSITNTENFTEAENVEDALAELIAAINNAQAKLCWHDFSE